MAKQTVTTYVDDMDETPGDDVTEVVFGWRSSIHSIDLNAVNTKRLEEALKPFIEKSRRLGPLRLNHLSPARRPASTTVKPTADREQNQAIREWARKQGHNVSDRGRIPATIVEEFNHAH